LPTAEYILADIEYIEGAHRTPSHCPGLSRTFLYALSRTIYVHFPRLCRNV